MLYDLKTIIYGQTNGSAIKILQRLPRYYRQNTNWERIRTLNT